MNLVKKKQIFGVKTSPSQIISFFSVMKGFKTRRLTSHVQQQEKEGHE